MNELIKQQPESTAIDKPLDHIPHSYNYGVDPNAENEVQLLDYWRAVRKRLWLVIAIAVLITTLSVIYVARKPDNFEATSRVQVDLENNPDFFKGNTTQKRSTWQTILRMAGFGGRDKPDQDLKPNNDLPLTTTVAYATAHEDLVEAKRLAPYDGAILGGLKVEPVKENRGYYKETRLIDLTFQHTDPQVAAKVVNAIADTYIYSNLQKKGETNSTTAEFLQKRVADLQQQIRADEEKLVNYAKNNQIISLSPNQNTVVERLAALNRQLVDAQDELIKATADYNAARAPDKATALADADLQQAR